MKINNEAKVEFKSMSVNESYARVCAAAFAAQLDPTLDELADIKTAVSEAVTNCIVHAYPDQIGKISMTMKIINNNCIYIVIKDYGIGIEDVKQAMEPCFTTAPTEERSGMGFTVMETFMDKMRITSKVGKGTRVALRKYIGSKNI